MQTRLFRMELVQIRKYRERVELKGRDAFEIENAFARTAGGSSASYLVHFIHRPHFNWNSTQFPDQLTTDCYLRYLQVQSMNGLENQNLESSQKEDRDQFNK